jgi:hypothetical protein
MTQTTEQLKEGLGIASTADIANSSYQTMIVNLAKVGASTSDVATAQLVWAKNVQQSADAMQVLRSSTPNFTQLILDLQNANKTKDELLTSSGNALLQAAPAFVQALQQGQTIAQAIATSLTGAANSIANAFAGYTTNSEDDDERFESGDVRQQNRGDRGHGDLRLGRQNPTFLVEDRGVHSNPSHRGNVRRLFDRRSSERRAA